MKTTSNIFPIVGVGASAGGIDSFKKFLSAVPENSGMAYVLVQHLDPSHDSLLPEILSRATNVPVLEITDDIQLQPDHIYILPANKMLVISDHSLKLTARDNKVQNLPIDFFFSSLGKVHKTLAVGVVLSGSAHDGTIGLKAIKEYGGITFAEDPKSAGWDGMPQSAIDAGVVDFILTPEKILEKLLQINVVYKNTMSWDEEKLPKGEEDAFRQILSLLKLSSNVDFNYYKQPTLKRRIARRMAINQTSKLTDYLKFLRGQKPEQEALFQDMLIQVTSFFRDPTTFKALEELVFPSIINKKSKGNDPIRIWVAGCATGEEAYSLAICLQEMLGGEAINFGYDGQKVQIFASDLSDAAIEKAREGVYSAAELETLSQTRLKNYFTKINSAYKVNKAIRDIVVFATHNFLKDPPFARMDLISCRNVFIYMDSFLQKKALGTFHYALKDHGYLLVGKAESVGASADLFVPLSKQEKIYSRKQGPGRLIPTQGVVKPEKKSSRDKKVVVPRNMAQPDFRKSAEAVLVSRHTPPSVIVDEHMEVVHISGTVTPFLEPPAGKPTFNLLKMAREGLGFELRNALYKSKTSKEPVKKTDIPIKNGEEKLLVSLEIIPLPDTVDPYYLILFSRNTARTSLWDKVWKKLNQPPIRSGKNEMQLQNEAMKKELAQVREDMRGISEEQEATNEELQSANEELLSSNEEMQSLNEELETSKEELQSTNEELIIINQELMDSQEQLKDYLHYTEAIVATLREPLLVLNNKLHIQSANAAFYKKFDAAEREIEGKPLFEIQERQWDNDKLKTLLNKILPEQEILHDFEIEIDLPSAGKRDLLLNARELVDGKKAERLILFAMEDVTEQKMAIENYQNSISQLKKTNEQLDQFVHVASHDLQEPLRKVLTFAGRLRDKGKERLTGQIETYLDKIETSASRMTSLIKDLLDYSRLSEPIDLFESTDLNENIGTILVDFEVLAEEKKAQINVGKLPVIQAIPVQMNQLFYNLIGNALKFSQKDVPPKVNITSRKLTQKEVTENATLKPHLEYVEIIVEDQGIGFDQKYEHQIFTIFQRLNQQSEYSGTGIGLAMVKRIVDNHQGKVFAFSKIGEGAEFHIILPVEQPAQEIVI